MMAAGWPRSALAWACLACVVGFSTAAAEPGEVERGLPGPVGRLVACETKMLGCLVDEAIEEIPLVRDERGRDDLAGAAPEDVLERALALRQTLTGLAAPATGPATVHFRTGDAIAAEVLTADEAHVRIRIATDREATIPVGFIRVVELAASVVKPIPKQKLALLTVPQTRRSVLPTHVLRMISGDYVRGRLLGIDDAVVQFEITGGNTKQLPRRDVSRIIWLATKGDPQPSPRSALEALDGLPVVAVSTHGRRLSLAARGLDGDMLAGEHPALGPVRVPLAGCAELLIGAAIDEYQPAERPCAQWVLSPAASTR